jgi:hypothetical protein
VDVDVVLAHATVDDAAHVLGDQRAAREDGALGAGLRAARVHEAKRVVVGHEHVRLAVVGVRGPVGDVLPAGISGGHDRTADTQLDVRLPKRLRGHLVQGVFDHEADGARVLEDVRDLACREHEVHGDEDRADPRRCVGQRGELPAVVRQQRDPVTLDDAALRERVRRAVHGAVELRVGPTDIAVDERELVGATASRPAQQVADRV